MRTTLPKIRFKTAFATATAAVLLAASPAYALVSPLGAAILAPVQFPPTSFTIVGARVSAIWGNHRDVYGLDVGAIGNMTEGSFAGIGVSGLFNYNKGTATVVGLQFAGITNININKTRVVGLQFAGALNMNKAESSVVGIQAALFNFSPATAIYGAQVGVYNRSNRVYGFQIGLINMTESLHGLQIGLVNFNKTGLFAVAPILNVGF